MENTDKKLDQLLANIQRQMPELTDAGILTDAIMNKITIIKENKKPVFLIWVRTLSSAVAIFLVALYLYQYSSNYDTAKTTTDINNIESNFKIDSDCIQRSKNQKVNFIKTYKCHIKQNSLKNKQLVAYYQQLIINKNENND